MNEPSQNPTVTATPIPVTNPASWPLVLRLTGVWLIWAAWSSASGWLLSATGALGDTGYLVSLPALMLPWILWWRHTRPAGPVPPRRISLRLLHGRTRWLRVGFQGVAALSLVAALIHVPWSFDAVTYRLPRCLYWLAEGRWYWIGTLDGRLDYSACGLEWQMIPVMLLTKTDRFLFLLSYLPFLLLPGLTYLGGRALGLARRPLLIWMWLLPSAYCIALQCSGLCNDGYSTTYTVACLAFSGVAIRRRDPLACIFAGSAASLLTGAKLSNLPLMLPLGVVFLVAAWRCGFFKRPAVVSLLPMALISFLPLAVMSLLKTGNWTGDPDDQWGFRTGNPVAAVVANLVIAGNDLTHPPVMAGAGAVNNGVRHIESSIPSFMAWLGESHKMFAGANFGDMVYEGNAGAGFSIGCFLAGGTLIGLFLKRNPRQPRALSWQKVAIIGGPVAWLVLLSQLGSINSPRNAAPYLPLLLFAFSKSSPFHRFLHSKAALPLALLGMASVVPIIILTPARPLVPLGLLDKCRAVDAISGPLSQVLMKYAIWEGMRDDLKPMRGQLPQGEAVIGYAGAFRDTGYGLWRPIGGRRIQEIGVPRGDPTRQAPIPSYVVATSAGVQQRFRQPIGEWMEKEHKEIRYSYNRPTSLDADGGGKPDEWYLLGPAATPKL